MKGTMAKHRKSGLDLLDELFEMKEFYGEIDCGALTSSM